MIQLNQPPARGSVVGHNKELVTLSANNLMDDDYLAGRVVDTGGIAQASATATRSYTTWALRLEMKL